MGSYMNYFRQRCSMNFIRFSSDYFNHYYFCTYDFHVAMNYYGSIPEIYWLVGDVSWTYQAENEGSGSGRVELYHSQAGNIYRIFVRKSTGKTKEVR